MATSRKRTVRAAQGSASKKSSAAPTRSKGAKKSVARSSVARETDRLRSRRVERALEQDSENEETPSSFSDSSEYIPGALDDELAKELGEAAVESATSGAQADEDIRDEDLEEDEGGPFVTTSARQEFARGVDGSNPRDAERAALPTTSKRSGD